MAKARILAALALISAAPSAWAQSDLTVDFGAAPPPMPLTAPSGPPRTATPPAAASSPAPAPPRATPVAPTAPVQGLPASAPAQAAPVAAAPPVMRNQEMVYTAADFTVVPTPQQIVAAYPLAGWRMSVRGRVTMDCRVTAAGLVQDCRVTDEASRGSGFDEAALRLAPIYRVRTQNGLPGATSIFINFSPADLKAAGAWNTRSTR